MATYASEPQRRVRDFCVSFRTCRSLDDVWIFRVGPATYKYGRAERSETTKMSSTLEACSFFRILSWNSASQPPRFLPSSCSTFCPSIWRIENSRTSLWNPRYSEKGDLPERFFSCYATNLNVQNSWSNSVSTYYWQFSTGNHFMWSNWQILNSSNSDCFPLCPPWSISNARSFFEDSTSIFCVLIWPRQSFHTI